MRRHRCRRQHQMTFTLATSHCEILNNNNNNNKPVGELVCALRGFPWTVTICDKWHHRPHDHKFRNICCPEIWPFVIFQDGGRPNLAFGTTGSRSIQSAVPENPTLGYYPRKILPFAHATPHPLGAARLCRACHALQWELMRSPF